MTILSDADGFYPRASEFATGVLYIRKLALPKAPRSNYPTLDVLGGGGVWECSEQRVNYFRVLHRISVRAASTGITAQLFLSPEWIRIEYFIHNGIKQ